MSCGPLGEMYKGHIFAKREAVAGHTLGHAVIPGQSKYTRLCSRLLFGHMKAFSGGLQKNLKS